MDRLIARLRRWAASAVLLGALAACATNPVTGRQDLVLVSEAQELALGRQAHQQTLTEYQPLSDPALQQYVDAVGQKLAAVSHRPGLTYTFTALDSPEINAFALPGGYVYITRGLLAYLNSEAELAAVLGHEIGHVTARHGVRQASSAQAAGLGAGLASIFFPELAATGLDQAVGVLGTALLRGYGREHELEADRLGAAYLAQAGYDPQAMFQVIRTLKNHELLDRRVAAAQGREPRAYHGLFATHPDNDTRLKEIIDHVPPAAGGGETARDRFLNQIDGLVFGEDPAGGVFREGRFWHAGLGFVLTPPRGWGGRNLPTRVVFGERSGRAQIQLTLVRREGQETPAALLERVGLGQLIRAAPIDAGGLPAIAGYVNTRVNGQLRPARLAVILLGEYGFLLTGAPRDPAALAAFDPVFLGVAGSFRRLADDERAALAPRRIVVTRPQAPVAWSSLAAASPIELEAEAQLRVLNAAEGAAAAAGERIKLVR